MSRLYHAGKDFGLGFGLGSIYLDWDLYLKHIYYHSISEYSSVFDQCWERKFSRSIYVDHTLIYTNYKVSRLYRAGKDFGLGSIYLD